MDAIAKHDKDVANPFRDPSTKKLRYAVLATAGLDQLDASLELRAIARYEYDISTTSIMRVLARPEFARFVLCDVEGELIWNVLELRKLASEVMP